MPSSRIILAVVFTSLLFILGECLLPRACNEKITIDCFCTDCGGNNNRATFKVELKEDVVFFLCFKIRYEKSKLSLYKKKKKNNEWALVENPSHRYTFEVKEINHSRENYKQYIVKVHIETVTDDDLAYFYVRLLGRDVKNYMDYQFMLTHNGEGIQKTTVEPGSITNTGKTCPNFKETKDTRNKHSQDADSTEEPSAPKTEESAIPVSTMIAIVAVTFILAVVILGVVCYWARAKLTNNMRPSEAVPEDGNQQPDMQAATDGNQEQEAGACGGAGADEEDSGRYVTDDGLVYVTVAHAKGKVKPQPGKNGSRNETKKRNEDRVEYVTLNYKFIKEQEDKKNSGE